METRALAPCPVFTDITQFDGQPFRGLVDIVSGGFPCTPFSCAGLREADGSDSHLFPHMLKAIDAIQPSIVFLENVEGIISSKLKGDHWNDPAGTSVLLHVCRELERINYKATWGLFSASETGASQQRKRVFILGVANSLGSRAPAWFPKPEQWKERHSEVLNDRCSGGWPASPGRPQHEWEEPRLVADADRGESGQKRGDDGEVPRVQKDQGQTDSAALPDGDRDNGIQSARGDMAHTQRSACSCGRGLCESGEPDGGEASGRRPEDQGANVEHAEGREAVERESRDMGEEAEGGKGSHAALGDAGRRKAEPKLGRAADGIERGVDAAFARVERLRMLGNGVVPQTAARALVTLLDEFYG